MASNINSYYICSPYSSPQLLRTSGEEPIELTISYLYELDVLTTTAALSSSFDLKVQQVSSTLLQRIATVSNLADCSGGGTNNSEDDDAPFRRRGLRQLQQQRQRNLRYKGRGSTSLIGIASNDNTIKSEQVCQFELLSGGEIINEEINQINDTEQQIVDEEEGGEVDNTTTTNLVTGDFSGSVLEAQEDSQQQQQQLQGERPTTTEEEDNTSTTNDVLAVTRVDGIVDPSSVILRSAPISTNQLEEIKEKEGEGNNGAYNYLSTRSEIKEAESSRTQPDNNVSLRQSNVVISSSNTAPPKLRSGAAPPGTKCNVVQGQITLFISNTANLSFENLDGRILEMIKDDLNNEVLLQDEFLKDGIVGLRLLEPALMVGEDGGRVPSSPLTPPISVAEPSVTAETTTAASSSSSPSNLNEAAPTSSGFASSTASIGVIGSLAAIFLTLIGLFAYTSRPRKRRRYRLGDGDGDEDDLKSAHEIYENELDAVSAVMSGNDAASLWWQEPIRMTDSFDSRSIMEASVPTVEACYSNKGVIISNDDIDEAFDALSPKKLPLSFFNRKSNKSRDEIMEDNGTSNLVAGELIKSDSLFDADESTVDMDAHLFNGVEKSKKSKSLRRFFGKKRTAADIADDVIIDEDISIQDIQSQEEAETETNEVLIQESYSQDQFGIETTRTAPLRPMEAYVSPTTIRSRSRLSEEDYAERILQTCSSGGLSSCIPYDLPAPEIGDEQSNISALTDNFFDLHSRRGPGCAVTECVAPTDDASVPTSVSMKKQKQQQRQQKQPQKQQQQLARRQANPNMDSFADCWNPFEGDFWQGWFD